jgi:hypothetical protein
LLYVPNEKEGIFFPASQKRVEAGEKNKVGWSGGWAVTILDREDAASCGRRTGLFYLAKDARRGEPQFQGKWGWENFGARGVRFMRD